MFLEFMPVRLKKRRSSAAPKQRPTSLENPSVPTNELNIEMRMSRLESRMISIEKGLEQTNKSIAELGTLIKGNTQKGDAMEIKLEFRKAMQSASFSEHVM